MEAADAFRRFEIKLDGAGTRLPGLQHEARSRIDRAARADRDEMIASSQRMVDFLHAVRHLAEPHNVRPKRAGHRTSWAYRTQSEVFMPDRVPAAARRAERFGDLAMHMNEVFRARHL